MDVVTTFQACLRRWYVVIPVLVLGILFAVVKFQQAAPVYELSTKLIVLGGGTVVNSSNASSSALATNPYASQISTAAEAATASSLSPGALQAVAAAGPTAAFSAISEQQSPIIDLTASSRDASTVRTALANFVLVAGRQFTQLQLRAGSPPQQLLQLQTLSAPGEATVSYPKRSRTLGTITLGSLVSAALAGLALDGVMGRGRRRRTQGTPRVPALGVEHGGRDAAATREARVKGEVLPERSASQRQRA